MTSAINGRIMYKQGTREWLEETIRPNSLAFDLSNNLILYSPSGTSYYEFYPGNNTSGFVSRYDFTNEDEQKLILVNSNVTNKNVDNISSASSFNYVFSGYRIKKYYIEGPSSGTYQATVVFYGANKNDMFWNIDNCISATISNEFYSTSAFYTNKLYKWSCELIINSGTIPTPGISAYVEV